MSIIRNRFSGDNSRSNHRPFGQAWSADGINDYINLNFALNTSILRPNTPFTVWGLYKHTSLSANNGMRITNDTQAAANKDFLSIDFKNPFGGGAAALVFHRRFVAGGTILQYWGIVCNYNLTVGRNYHVVVTCDGSLNILGLNIYINGRKMPVTITFNQYAIASYNPTDPQWQLASRGPNVGNTIGGLADFGIAQGYCATDSEVERLYNFARSYSEYPSNILSNRILHLSLSQPNDFDVNASQLRALDMSGLNRHCNVFGQGTTPTLVNVY